MYTWNDLITRASAPFTDQGSLSSDTRKYLIEAQEQFVSRTRSLVRRKWLYVDSNSEYVALPADLDNGGNLLRAEFRGELLTYRGLPGQSSHDYTDLTVPYGSPGYYDIYDGKFFFIPGASSAGWLCLWYNPTPIVLDDDATKYHTIDYDGLTKHFYVGETITVGSDSDKLGNLTFTNLTSYSIIHADGAWTTLGAVVGSQVRVSSGPSNAENIGTFTITSISGGDAAVSDTNIVDEGPVGCNFTILAPTATIVKDDNLRKTGTLTVEGLSGTVEDDKTISGSSGGSATVNGDVLTSDYLTTAGDYPDIPNEWRTILVNYAKSKLYEDEEDESRKDYFLKMFEYHVDRVRQEVIENKMFGANVIMDVM